MSTRPKSIDTSFRRSKSLRTAFTVWRDKPRPEVHGDPLVGRGQPRGFDDGHGLAETRVELGNERKPAIHDWACMNCAAGLETSPVDIAAMLAAVF